MFKIILIILGMMGVISALVFIGYVVCFFVGEEVRILDKIFEKWRR